ncbi:hypothetical protein AAFC00_007021 [Neodothiora populina]|uniref:t-SNARE coiled-coil homology domain-containing protein n=1 Tax=Neodothiora populina TaxID=2781224 RepID=A0ABR3PC78_9PEZI
MPFGLSKKDKDKEKSRDESSSRSALFGGRSKSQKAAPAAANPYAVQASTPDPYASKPADPYAASRPSIGTPQGSTLGAPPGYDGRSPSPMRNDKSPVPIGGYGGGPSAPRFGGQGNYGQQGGYGNTPYAADQPQASRAGGYGGLGRTNSNETMGTDAGRAALFGDAPQRQLQQQLEPPSAAQDNSYAGGSNGYNANSAGPSDANRDALFGGAGQRQQQGGYGGSSSELYDVDNFRTAEEQEEEDVQAAKSEIKFIKQQDVSSTRNALRIAQQAEATGRETLARLGAQGDRIHNTEHNLDMASNQNRLAEEKARELKTLNRSMFAVHVANPFTAKKREEAALAIALDKHQTERRQMDDTRSNAYSTTARHQAQGRDLKPIRHATDKASLAQRAKYQFEADSEDDEMENEIDGNLEAIHKGARSLNMLGRAMGEELDEQNKHIARIIDKTDTVDDQIALNRARLNRIR